MELRELVPGYVVSPQIEAADVPMLAAAGFRTVINNRPDREVSPDRSAAAIRAAVDAAGMVFVDNPITHGAITAENARIQRDALDQAGGPVFAYCQSGNRCAIIWALAMAQRQPADALIGAAARWGYNLERYRDAIEAQATA